MPEADRRRPGCLGLLVAAALPFVAAGFVKGRTDGPFNFYRVPETFFAWLALPVAAVAANRLWPTRRRLAVALPAVTLVGLLGLTAWAIRPQAPTGADHVESLPEGEERLEAELRQALDAVLQGRWARERLVPKRQECRDGFGRGRGADRAVYQVPVEPATREEVDALRQQLTRQGWDTSIIEADYVGGRTKDLVASRSGYSLSLWPIRLDGRPDDGIHVTAFTPCLRRR